jgi:hypothetical protein
LILEFLQNFKIFRKKLGFGDFARDFEIFSVFMGSFQMKSTSYIAVFASHDTMHCMPFFHEKKLLCKTFRIANGLLHFEK